jgi:hypothetical protein
MPRTWYVLPPTPAAKSTIINDDAFCEKLAAAKAIAITSKPMLRRRFLPILLDKVPNITGKRAYGRLNARRSKPASKVERPYSNPNFKSIIGGAN